ncbi:alpha/beta fold hydrolase [Streptomyces sp. bgisy022]|uniref:alpha/beta fold hydrolase n=1 Tax=Streptomyces sp. bgisy022 TaxID=3413769 RepID=UPI003D741B4C
MTDHIRPAAHHGAATEPGTDTGAGPGADTSTGTDTGTSTGSTGAFPGAGVSGAGREHGADARHRSRTHTTVPVTGGDLAVTHWPGTGAPVIALHGITANSLAFAALAEALPRTDLHALDLRGRAASAHLPGPYGLTAHIEDTLAVLDHLGRHQAVLIGHSMGAFIAALAAARHPDRFPHVILLDGGLPLPLPPDCTGSDGGPDAEQILHRLIGPALDRLALTFASREAYHAHFRENPGVGPYWDHHFAAYVDHDLAGRPPAFRSSCRPEAVRTDATDILTDADLHTALHRPHTRAALLYAERGALDQPEPFYTPQQIATHLGDATHVTAQHIKDTNHYTILHAPTPDTVAVISSVLDSTGTDRLTNRQETPEGEQAAH